MSVEYIDSVYAAGDDALGYEFEISMSKIPLLSGDTSAIETISVRTATVNIPSSERGDYTFDYKTRTIKKSNGKVTTANEFDFDFRIDKNWALYKYFLKWSNIVGSNAGASGDFSIGGASPIRTDITVKTIDANGNYTSQVWVFKGCWCSSVGSVSLDNSSGDPLTLTVTMSFLTMA